MWRYLMSMACTEVKTEVEPCTTHSLVSGMAIGVHLARKTGCCRGHKLGGRCRKWPWTNTTCATKIRRLICVLTIYSQMVTFVVFDIKY